MSAYVVSSGFSKKKQTDTWVMIVVNTKASESTVG